MSVFCCTYCDVILTMRHKDLRQRDFCFPHSDDFCGCDICGTLYCGSCRAEIGPNCPQCGGRLHANRRCEPTGEYRLPPGLRVLKTVGERVSKVGELWDAGKLSFGHRDYLLRIIAEQARKSP